MGNRDKDSLEKERERFREKEIEILAHRVILVRQLLTGIGIAVTFWSTLLAGAIFTQDANFKMQDNAGFMFLSTGALAVCALVGCFWYLRLLNNALHLSGNRIELAKNSQLLSEYNDGEVNHELHTADMPLSAEAQARIPTRTEAGLTFLLLVCLFAVGLTLACFARWLYLVRHSILDLVELAVTNPMIIASLFFWVIGAMVAIWYQRKALGFVNDQAAELDRNSEKTRIENT